MGSLLSATRLKAGSLTLGYSAAKTGKTWFFMGFTKRNMTVAQDDSGAGVSSLDNASIEWIAPRQMTFAGLGVTTSFLLGFQITSPSERGEVYAFQPALVNSQNYPQRFCQDWKVIGPYLTAAQDNLPVKIPVRWHGIASQPILDMHRLAAQNPVWIVTAHKESA